MTKFTRRIQLFTTSSILFVACSPTASQTCFSDASALEARVNFHSILFYYQSWYSIQVKQKSNSNWTTVLDKQYVDSGEDVCNGFRIHFNEKRKVYTIDFNNIDLRSSDFGKIWTQKR
jgi:hypothetical protein